MSTVPTLQDEVINQLAEALQGAASHRDLTDIFKKCGIQEPPDGGASRPSRIKSALKAKQAQDRCGNNVVGFLQKLLAPVRFLNRKEEQTAYIEASNKILAFSGLHIDITATVHAVAAARTIDEAEDRAGRLKAELARRRVHADVLRFCRAELLQENYFHAILEATKSVAEKIRTRTGLTEDGSDLVDKAFAKSRPLLAWSALTTPTEHNEHSGTMNLLKGMFGLFRNPTAHEPKINRTYSEDEALELLTVLSLLHRRIDDAFRTTFQP